MFAVNNESVTLSLYITMSQEIWIKNWKALISGHLLEWNL